MIIKDTYKLKYKLIYVSIIYKAGPHMIIIIDSICIIDNKAVH